MENPRFHVSSLNSTVTLQMNLEATALLFHHIRNMEDADPCIFSMSERFRQQFFYMNQLEMLENDTTTTTY